jgi:tyrosine-protein kinase
MEGDSIDLRSQAQVLVRRWRVVTFMTVLGVAAGLALAFNQSPQYTARSEVLVEPLTVQLPSSGIIVQPGEIETQIKVIESQPVAQQVIDELHLAVTPSELLRTVTVAAVDETRVLDIEVTRGDRNQAAAIANAFSAKYLEYRHQLAAERAEAAVKSYTSQVTDLQAQLQTATEDINTAPNEQAKQAAEARRQGLLIQLTQASTLLAANQSPDLPGGEILVDANPPKKPSAPKPIRSGILGGVIGLLAGIGLAFARDHLDDVVRDEARLAEILGGTPVLGQIPHWAKAPSNRLASLLEPSSPSAEAFRSLNTNVRFLLAAAPADPENRHRGRVLLMSSADPKEGKSSVAANLAVAAARVGLKVALVDGDIRNPTLGGLFGMGDSTGLSDVLASGEPVGDHMLDVGVPNLLVLPGGQTPPNPAELLASPAMRSIIDDLTRDYELVIIDSSPVMRVADSLELVRTADLVLLVARSGVSHWRHVQAVPDRIRKVGGVVSGVVLNDVPARASQFTYGYHNTVSGAGSRAPASAESGTELSRAEVERRGSAVPAASARKMSTVRANAAKRGQKKPWSGQPKKSPDKRQPPGKSGGGSR